MEYEATILVPPYQAGSSRAKIALQMLPVARADDYTVDELKGLVTFKFKGSYKKYIHVFAFFSQFNVSMEKKYINRTFKYMAGKHYAEMEKYYKSPACVTIIVPPTDEELTEEEKSMFQKAKEWMINNGSK